MPQCPTPADLARLVNDYFASRGKPVAYDPDSGMGSIEGAEFGVHNLAANLALIQRERWAEFTAWHFDLLIGDGPPQISTRYSEVRRHLRVRLASTEWVNQLPSQDIARAVADDLHEVLMVSLQATAVTVPPDHIEAWGEEPERVWREARENTVWDEPVERRLAVRPTGERLTWVRGGWWVASLLLDLGRYLSPSNPHGAMVMVPVRDALLYHEITNDSVVSSLKAMLGVGLGFHFDGPHPISPHIYWWQKGQIRRIVAYQDDEVHPVWGREFKRMLAEVEASTGDSDIN